MASFILIPALYNSSHLSVLDPLLRPPSQLMVSGNTTVESWTALLPLLHKRKTNRPSSYSFHLHFFPSFRLTPSQGEKGRKWKRIKGVKLGRTSLRHQLGNPAIFSLCGLDDEPNVVTGSTTAGTTALARSCCPLQPRRYDRRPSHVWTSICICVFIFMFIFVFISICILVRKVPVKKTERKITIILG